MTEVQQNNEQILNDIQSLQQMEQQLFSSLETDPNMSTEKQKKIIDKMNEISNMRINLYQTLSGLNTYFENVANTSADALRQQETAVKIVENELNKSKQRLRILEEEKNNKIRLVEINTYYGDRYAEHSQLMKIIIFMLLPVILVSVLYNKGLLPKAVYMGILVVVALIGGFFFWKRFLSIITRDNMNYDAYNWPFNPSEDTGDENADEEADDPWTKPKLGTCVGEACCVDGMVYDEENNRCVAEADYVAAEDTEEQVDNEDTEGFAVSQILSKTQTGKYKNDYDMKQPATYNAFSAGSV